MGNEHAQLLHPATTTMAIVFHWLSLAFSTCCEVHSHCVSIDTTDLPLYSITEAEASCPIDVGVLIVM